MNSKEKLDFIFNFLKEDYGSDSHGYWLNQLDDVFSDTVRTEEISPQKALELANSILECGRIFETLKQYFQWNFPKIEIETLDHFSDEHEIWKQANSSDFKSFIINSLNKPDVFTHFCKVQASVCNICFLGHDAPQQNTVYLSDAEKDMEKIAVFKTFKNNIFFLKDADLFCENEEDRVYDPMDRDTMYKDPTYVDTMYSAIFYIIEYYKNVKKEIPSFFMTTITNQILFLCQQDVNDALSYLEYICLEELLPKTMSFHLMSRHLNWCLNQSLKRIQITFASLKKVSPLFTNDTSGAWSLFFNLGCTLREYFYCALHSSLSSCLTRQTYISNDENIDQLQEKINKTFKEKYKEVEKAFDSVNW